jgi:hypothetical protein
MTDQHLLPANATPLERGLALTFSRLNAVSAPIDTLLRAEQCPASLLPWLAWAVSVDLWDESWPEVKQRAIIAESFALHRRKGTVYAIGRYLAYAGAELKRAITPPDKAFAGDSMTAAERSQWLARFPQIRIYAFRDRGRRTYGSFTRGTWRWGKTFLAHGRMFPYRTDAAARLGRRAFLWDKGGHHLATGKETPLRWLERTSISRTGIATRYEQLLVPGTTVKALFLGSMATGNAGGQRFPLVSAAGARIVSLAVEMEYATQEDRVLPRFAVPSGLRPISAFPEKVAERGIARRGVQIFAGATGSWLDPAIGERRAVKGFLRGYLPPTSAGFRLYDRFALHDPARLPVSRRTASHLGAMRLGMPAFHLQLDIAITGRRGTWQAGRFISGCLTASSQRSLTDARTAIQRSKAARDKVLIATRLHRPLSTRDGARTSSGYRSGSIIATH